VNKEAVQGDQRTEKNGDIANEEVNKGNSEEAELAEEGQSGNVPKEAVREEKRDEKEQERQNVGEEEAGEETMEEDGRWAEERDTEEAGTETTEKGEEGAERKTESFVGQKREEGGEAQGKQQTGQVQESDVARVSAEKQVQVQQNKYRVLNAFRKRKEPEEEQEQQSIRKLHAAHFIRGGRSARKNR